MRKLGYSVFIVDSLFFLSGNGKILLFLVLRSKYLEISWGSFLKKYIFSPLFLSRTFWSSVSNKSHLLLINFSGILLCAASCFFHLIF